MSMNPYESPEAPAKLPASKSGGCQFTLLKLLGAIGLSAILVALLLPSVRIAGPAAHRTHCSNNLKQIALALHNYASDHDGLLPPAFTIGADGKPLHSWRTLILPYLEQQQLYDSINLSKPWDDPANKKALETKVDAYRCPSGTRPDNYTGYLAVVADGSCLRAAEPRDFVDITDDDSPTLLVIEVDDEHAVPWISPQDASEELVLSLGKAKHLPHSAVQAAMADGSVRGLSKGLKPDVWRALITISGGDGALAQQAD